MTMTKTRWMTRGLAAVALAGMLALAGCTGSGSGSGSDGTDGAGDSAAVEQRFADDEIMPEYFGGAYALQAGDTAPDFTVELVDANGLTGKTLTLSDLRGTVVLLDFWAPWCPYCVADLPSWQQLAEEYKDRIVVLEIDVGGDTFGEMKQFIADSGYDFIWAITTADVAAAYPCQGVPYTLVIGKDGVITFTAEGSYGRYACDVMKGQLEAALQ